MKNIQYLIVLVGLISLSSCAICGKVTPSEPDEVVHLKKVYIKK